MESGKSSVSECEKISIQTEQLSKLVCPVCYEYMKPPIMECEKGHGICELCYELLSKCPICNNALTNRRSSHLETLTSLVLFPCKNCGNKFSLDELPHHKCADLHENSSDNSCLIGQVYGECNWRGQTKDMIEHCNRQHPNNYWTRKENLARWNFCHLSNVGIQNVYVLDLTESLFVIVQKYDSNTQALQWNISCECEKVSEQFVYEIQLFSDYTLETLKCRNVIENGDNVMMSLPSSNEIVIPISKVTEFLCDNSVNYKVIIHKKSDIQKDRNEMYYQAFTEMRNDSESIQISDGTKNETKPSCVQKMWQSVVDFYEHVKKRLGFS